MFLSVGYDKVEKWLENHSSREMGKKTLVTNFYLDGVIVTLQVNTSSFTKKMGK